MTHQERRGWFIVASLFIILLLVFGGGYDTVPVLLPALLKGFPHWSRQRVSILPSVLAASAGISVLPVGWLIDRVEARIVMAVGALAVGGAFLIASQSNSLTPMIFVYLLVGVGIAAGTILPGALVLANWFNARRGMAMGIANSGSTAGGMVMTLVAGYAIVRWGWRGAYLTLGLPMLIIAVPLILLSIRSRPPGAIKMTVAQAAETLEGFESGPAMRTRSFWLIVIAQFCFAFAATGTAIHMVAHLEGLGYSSSRAALAMSLIYGFATIGKVVMGFMADRLTARNTLGLCFIVQAVGTALVFLAANPVIVVLFVIVYGLTVAAPLMLLPLVTAESLGLKRFGFIAGMTGLAQTFGAAIGPLVAGRIFDVMGSYTAAFELFIMINLIGAAAAFACRSYSAERTRRVSAAPSPAPA
ncbi:MAG TPA: MFS transporter [Candidatus Binataceae bacterium]|nr:MFS transporter [Candidatus Binataceae bacterium]